MNLSNFNLRNIPQDVLLNLKKEARDQKTSVNSLILQILEQKYHPNHTLKKGSFHDLDYLAGTWNEQDEQEFKKKIKSLENIDEELWS